MKNIIYSIILYFFFPITILQRAISKFILIRTGIIESIRIGHFVGESTLWIFQKKLEKKERRLVLDFWFCEKKGCNKFFSKKIKKKLNLTHNYLIKLLHDSNRNFYKKNFFILDGPKSTDRDVLNLIPKNESIISFSNDEIDFGFKKLRELGIDKDEEFVCLSVRDSYYLNKTFPNKDWSYHDYKDSNVNNFNLAVEELNKKNIKVVRMGKGAGTEWSHDKTQNIDYALSKLRSDFLDFFLVKFSKFTISNTSGFILIPIVLKKPLVLMDYVPIGYMYTFVQNSIHTFKHYYSIEEKRYLNLKELLSEKYSTILKTQGFKELKIKLVDNNPNEIKDCVLEMNSRLDNTWKSDLKEQEEQRRFWAMFPNNLIRKDSNKVLHGEIETRIGVKFLKNYISKYIQNKI